jgi:hypothetical protein
MLGSKRIPSVTVLVQREEAKVPIRKQEILQLLGTAPDGLTSVEVAAGLGAKCHDVDGRLSKLAAYGDVEKLKGPSSLGKAKWRVNYNKK